MKDLTNNILADIRYNPSFENTYSGMFSRSVSWISGAKAKVNNTTGRENRADDIIVTVSSVLDFDDKKSKNKEIFKGHGCWLSYLIIDGKEFWKLEDDVPAWKLGGELSDGY